MAVERQGNGMGTARERHGMCESALRQRLHDTSDFLQVYSLVIFYSFTIKATILELATYLNEKPIKQDKQFRKCKII
jgi:hypothetical protein